MTPLTLVEVLAGLPDPRSRHGPIHPLPAVLALVVLGLLTGRNSLAGIARLGRQYARAAGARPRSAAQTPPKRCSPNYSAPSTPTPWRPRRAAGRTSRLAAEPEHISLAGKTLKGSRDGPVPGQHLVALYAPAAQAVLAQLRVDAKTNEHKAALQLLGLLPLAGKVVGGGMPSFCQRDLARQVGTAGGDPGATTCSWSRTTRRGCKPTLPPASVSRPVSDSIAAAFSPRGAAACVPAAGQHGRQGARPPREAQPGARRRSSHCTNGGRAWRRGLSLTRASARAGSRANASNPRRIPVELATCIRHPIRPAAALP